MIFLKQALIIIDYTNDFVASDGALTCDFAGQILEKSIAEKIQEFFNKKQLIIFANDLHKENDPYHPETKLFPPHNIENTEGRKLFGKIQNIYDQINHLDEVITLDKTRYSAFTGTRLELILRERQIDEIFLVGVCTDICILHTAVDAYNLGFKTTIFKDCVGSFNEAGHDWALTHFENTLGFAVK